MIINKTKVFSLNKEPIYSYELKNDLGFQVNILNLGGTITDILAPDKDGKLENVVLKFENIEDYIENKPYFGCIVGRTAGRIAKGEFELFGKKYRLPINNNGNNLHGGAEGFNKKIWQVEERKYKDKIGIRLYYYSIDEEEGYPGNIHVYVTYWVTNENELIVEYEGNTDKPTLLNMTNHSYFNLSGNYKKNILRHDIYINSDYIVELDENQIPSGKLLKVEGTPFDFNKIKNIGSEIDKPHEQLIQEKGYDHPWILNDKQKGYQAMLLDEESGRVLEIYTDRPTVVCYTLNFPCDERLEYGIIAKKHDAICFETQNIPDGINHENFSKAILMPNEEFYSKTMFKFRTMNLKK